MSLLFVTTKRTNSSLIQVIRFALILCVGQARDYFQTPALAVFLHFLFYEINIQT